MTRARWRKRELRIPRASERFGMSLSTSGVAVLAASLLARVARARVHPTVETPGTVRSCVKGLITHRPNMPRLAVTAGSRGIPGVEEIVRATVDALLELGASPPVGSAMGSHGGATSEGQRRLLAP